jgi:REP-associated tyrosine transposase
MFGRIENGKMRLNRFWEIVQQEWGNSAQIRPEIIFDEFIIMPNHLHGIVIINQLSADTVGAHGRAPLHRKPRSLGSFITGFKSIVTKGINEIRLTPCSPVWQRNYYEHIIRNDYALAKIREYIHYNPLKWDLDRDNPNRSGTDEFDKWLEGHHGMVAERLKL